MSNREGTKPSSSLLGLFLPENRRRLQSAAVLAASFYALLSLVSFGSYPLDAQLDHSWVAVITHAAEHRWQFGREIVFTMGPLGHLLYSTYSPVLFLPDLVAQIAIKALYLWALISVALRLPVVRRIAFVAAALVTAWFNYEMACFLLVVWTGGVLSTGIRFPRPLLGALIFFVAVAALMKATFLFLSFITGGIAAIALLARRRFLSTLVLGFGFISALVLLWWGAGQEFRNVTSYLASAAEISSGYSEAMSLEPTGFILVAGLLVLVGATIQLALVARNERNAVARWTGSTLFAFAIFVAWKLGYARADAHTSWFFCYTGVMALALPAFTDPGTMRPGRLLEGCVTAAIVVLCTVGAGTQLPAAGRVILGNAFVRPFSNAKALMRPRQIRAEQERQFVEQAKAVALPQTKLLVRNATLDLVGYEQGVAIANQFNYRPAPVFQGYNAYTRDLVARNTGFYASPTRPEFVLFKLQTIDRRLPACDNAGVTLILADAYRPVLTEDGFVLFQRARRRENRSITPAAMMKAAYGQPIPLGAGALWCKLSLRESLLGRVVRILYHSPALNLRLITDRGEQIDRRIVPSLAEGGFLLSPCLLTTEDFHRFVKGESGAAKVQSFMVLPPSHPSLFAKGFSWGTAELNELAAPEFAGAVRQ